MQGWIMIALLGGALLVGSPAALDQRDDPDALKKQVEQLQQRVDELEKKQAARCAPWHGGHQGCVS